jgi:hypothetical protein
MKIDPVGSLPTRKASNANFTGDVYVDPIVVAPAPTGIRIPWGRPFTS